MPAPDSLADAIRRFPPGEDRTTAALAVVCAIDAGFASALIREATGTSVDVDSVETNLQVFTPLGRRVDLELVARRGAAPLRVWFEAKWDAAWQPDQLFHYAQALGARGTLAAIVPARRLGEVTPPTRGVTWERIAVLVDQRGVAAGGTRWRLTASNPDASGRQRVLALFLDHLEREHQMATSPLRIDHAMALRAADEAITIADRLAQEAMMRTDLKPSNQGKWANGTGAWWTFPEDDEHGRYNVWHPGAWQEFQRSPNGAHQADGPPDPVFLCGISLPKRAIERLEQADLADWRARIAAEHRFTVSGGGREWTRMFTALPLAVVATASASFDGQATYLAQWLATHLQAAANFDPGVTWDAA